MWYNNIFVWFCLKAELGRVCKGAVACAWQVARVGFGAMEILPQHAAASAATTRAFYPKTESKAEAGEGWRGQQQEEEQEEEGTATRGRPHMECARYHWTPRH